MMAWRHRRPPAAPPRAQIAIRTHRPPFTARGKDRKRNSPRSVNSVMPALVAGIPKRGFPPPLPPPALYKKKNSIKAVGRTLDCWIAGTSPAMTKDNYNQLCMELLAGALLPATIGMSQTIL